MALTSKERSAHWRAAHPGRGAQHAAVWRERNPDASKDSQRRYKLKMNHDITLEQFDVMLSIQGGRCAICGTDEPGGNGTWHVDHNHETGDRRGLLCSNCNRCLGLLKDDIFILESAIVYLKKSESE